MDVDDDFVESQSSTNINRRVIEYEKLAEDLDKLDENYSDLFISETSRILQKTSHLLEDSISQSCEPKTSEHVASSKLMLHSTSKIKSCLKNIQGDSHTYDQNDLADHFKDNKLFWSIAPHKQIPLWYSQNVFSSEISGEVKKSKMPRRTISQAVGKETIPEKINSNEPSIISSDKVSKTLKVVQKLYKENKEKPISFYKLALDPKNFSRSLQNIFHLAFLIRDANVAIKMDNDIPYIEPIPKEERNLVQSQHVNDFDHCIFTLNMAKWKKLVSVFNVTESMMKF